MRSVITFGYSGTSPLVLPPDEPPSDTEVSVKSDLRSGYTHSSDDFEDRNCRWCNEYSGSGSLNAFETSYGQEARSPYKKIETPSISNERKEESGHSGKEGKDKHDGKGCTPGESGGTSGESGGGDEPGESPPGGTVNSYVQVSFKTRKFRLLYVLLLSLIFCRVMAIGRLMSGVGLTHKTLPVPKAEIYTNTTIVVPRIELEYQFY